MTSLHDELRRRLLLLVAAVWLAAAGLSSAWVWHEAGEVLDSALQETAERLALLPEQAFAQPDTAALLARAGEHREHIVYQVFEQGRLRWRSHAAPEAPLDPQARPGLTETAQHRLYTLVDGTRRVQVAEPLGHRAELARASLGGLLLMLLPLLGLTAAALAWTLRQSFARLAPLREQLRAQGLAELAPLPLEAAPRELQPWVEGVNELLVRVRRLLEVERAFAGHAAHELRTPIAAARAQLQRLQAACPSGEPQEPIRAALRQLDRMNRLCTRLLQLARVEAGRALQREPVDLNALAELVLQEVDRHAAERLLLAPAAAPLWVAADADSLAIALRNLVANALEHGPGRVVVSVRRDAQGACLGVSDDGPGVAPEQLAHLVRPWTRAADRQRPLLGSGLGLALVQRIAEESGGRLVLRSPLQDGRGFGAFLHLPAGSPPGAAPADAGPEGPQAPAR